MDYTTTYCGVIPILVPTYYTTAQNTPPTPQVLAKKCPKKIILKRLSTASKIFNF